MPRRPASLTILCLTLFILSACNGDYSPRRRGYFKVDFPPHQYQSFDRPDFPYTFEYPVYANVIRDSSYFDSVPENPYWINIDFPRFSARIYVSYKQIGAAAGHSPIDGKPLYNTFDQLRNDAFKMTLKHTVKASSIEDSAFTNPAGVAGVFFRVGGNAATAQQFFVTDTVRNFLRGALYFDASPNEDSLSHVNRFIQEDMTHLINTFKWKNVTGAAPSAPTVKPSPASTGTKPTAPSAGTPPANLPAAAKK